MFSVYCSSENISYICYSYTIQYRPCNISEVYTMWLLLTAKPQIYVIASVLPGTYPYIENLWASLFLSAFPSSFQLFFEVICYFYFSLFFGTTVLLTFTVSTILYF